MLELQLFTPDKPDPLTIDCECCELQGTDACEDCVVTFLLGFGCAVPFMDTSLYVGAASKALAGADIAYFVGFAATAILYAPLRLGWIGPSRATVETAAPVADQVAG